MFRKRPASVGRLSRHAQSGGFAYEATAETERKSKLQERARAIIEHRPEALDAHVAMRTQAEKLLAANVAPESNRAAIIDELIFNGPQQREAERLAVAALGEGLGNNVQCEHSERLPKIGAGSQGRQPTRCPSPRLLFRDRWLSRSHTHPSRLASAGRRFMRRRIIFAVTMAARLCVVIVGLAFESASAVAAFINSKPKTPAGRIIMVKVTNWREADLVELDVVESGLANWKKVLSALKAGQWTWVKVLRGKNCHVDLRGKYADGKSADVSNVDICADNTVDLVN